MLCMGRAKEGPGRSFLPPLPRNLAFWFLNVQVGHMMVNFDVKIRGT